MSSSSDYLDRLKGIREKYGCSQSKQSSYIGSQPYALQRTSTSSYQKTETYMPDRKKYTDSFLNTQVRPSATDYSLRPQSSIGLGSQNLSSQTYTGVADFSKRAERQRQIEQIRQNYAASRKKVIEDFTAKPIARDYSRQIPRNASIDRLKYNEKDYLKSTQKDYTIDYNKQRRYGYKDIQTSAYPRSSIYDHAQQSVSPIKRMTEYQDRKSYRKQAQLPDRTSDAYWRERQTKLTEMTSNRLNDSNRILLMKDDKILQHKLLPSKRSGIYTDHVKTYGQAHGLSKIDLQNKPSADYSVSNIDKIQQRIQSILNKR